MVMCNERRDRSIYSVLVGCIHSTVYCFRWGFISLFELMSDSCCSLTVRTVAHVCTFVIGWNVRIAFTVVRMTNVILFELVCEKTTRQPHDPEVVMRSLLSSTFT